MRSTHGWKPWCRARTRIRCGHSHRRVHTSTGAARNNAPVQSIGRMHGSIYVCTVMLGKTPPSRYLGHAITKGMRCYLGHAITSYNIPSHPFLKMAPNLDLRCVLLSVGIPTPPLVPKVPTKTRLESSKAVQPAYFVCGRTHAARPDDTVG